jgi:hypothetical protein
MSKNDNVTPNTITSCKCGCGRWTINKNGYIDGHIFDCKCGCGRWTINKNGYIDGHIFEDEDTTIYDVQGAE